MHDYFAARKRCVCLVNHRNDFETSAFALPEGQGFLNGVLFALEPAALDGLLHERPLVRRKFDVHSPIVAVLNEAWRERLLTRFRIADRGLNVLACEPRVMGITS